MQQESVKKQIIVTRKYSLRQKCDILLDYIRDHSLQGPSGERADIDMDEVMQGVFATSEFREHIQTLYRRLPDISSRAIENLK
jgi:hypothetical protein